MSVLLFPANIINFRDLLSITILTEDDYLERAESITKILHDNFDDMVYQNSNQISKLFLT